MDIKNKLKQIREGSMSLHFCTDSNITVDLSI